jgi:Cu-processing system permease protein
MLSIVAATFKGVFRDRVFHGIIVAALLFLFIPAAASLSMRQVTELSITLSLSLISFILLLLAVFLGGVSLWRDIEKRYTYSVLGLPLTRSSYVLGRFAGTALFLFCATLLLAATTVIVTWYCSGIYPSERPVVWNYLLLAMLFDFLKYILLIAIAFLFSTVSTSFFLPIFGTISIFLVGSASQQVYDFINSPAGRKLPVLTRGSARALYYILPNFTSFDLKLNAVYGIAINIHGLLLTSAYFIAYTAVVLCLATMIFSAREMK